MGIPSFITHCSARTTADAIGAALRPFRDTRPLLQGNAYPCRGGLVSRKEGKALPTMGQRTTIPREAM
ncbi:hypothetical protein GEV38_01835 [Pseudomonas sp. 13159349]|nr:hypothetical protein GEV38_01835 [Pseudomonas sp. 13159349]TXI01322.1 MAG: hypothetical protein E6Q70_20570 [Pseudomonas monteilii]